MPNAWKNKLYFGDNLHIMREHIPDESVDLIYLDPPFNSKATYNVLFQEQNGTQSAAQITAFEDTWHWNMDAEDTYHELVTQGPRKLADLVQALRSFLGQNDMMAYLVMMAIRLVEMHRVLKSTGSIYLHCDPTASHYIKLVLDAIWGPHYFRSEIIWKRTSAHSGANRYGPIHDVIFYYSISDRYTWNPQFQPFDEHYFSQFYTHKDPDGRCWRRSDLTGAGVSGGETGKPWRGIDVTAKGRHWRRLPSTLDLLDEQGKIHWPNKKDGMPMLKLYADEQPGVPLQDVWTDIKPMHNLSQERMGYPTQKPESLLERIIKASSNEGDLILDPFCGCGTTIAVAERLNRRWLGIDITHLAITLMKHRLEDAFDKELSPYEVVGDPKDLTGAIALAEYDRYQFEWWALGKVAARPAQDKKKGADSGIDGYIFFREGKSIEYKKIIVQVKSGNVNRAHIATLRGDMQREKAEIGVFLTLHEPSRPMVEEAATAGHYESPLYLDRKYPRIQIVTIEELLSGKELLYPKLSLATFKKAERQSKGNQGEQAQMW